MRRLALLALALSALTMPAAAEPLIGRASVIDADTIEMHGKRIRLEGIDAPESRQICTVQGERIPCGRRAAFFLADMIGERPVTCSPDGLDRYRRVLAHCTVDGADIGSALVRAGWALAFTRYSREYVADEETARRVGAGLWAMEFIAPWEWRAAGRRTPQRIPLNP